MQCKRESISRLKVKSTSASPIRSSRSLVSLSRASFTIRAVSRIRVHTCIFLFTDTLYYIIIINLDCIQRRSLVSTKSTYGYICAQSTALSNQLPPNFAIIYLRSEFEPPPHCSFATVQQQRSTDQYIFPSLLRSTLAYCIHCARSSLIIDIDARAECVSCRLDRIGSSLLLCLCFCFYSLLSLSLSARRWTASTCSLYVASFGHCSASQQRPRGSRGVASSRAAVSGRYAAVDSRVQSPINAAHAIVAHDFRITSEQQIV